MAELAQQRLEMDTIKENRRRLEQFAKRIGTHDGSGRDALRAWMTAIDHAAEWTGATNSLILEMVGYLATGSLATTIRQFVRDAQAQDRTWVLVKAAVVTHYLADDEQEYLRSIVEGLRQNPYEDSREYGRRFQTAVQDAYDRNQLEIPLVMERLVKLFVGGIRDAQVRTHINLQRPAHITRAIALANTAARAVSLSETDRRIEEPMEIGALPLKKTTPPEMDSLMELVTELKGAMKGLQKQVGRMEREIHDPVTGPAVTDNRGGAPNKNIYRGIPRQTRTPPHKFGKPAWTDDGRPVCYACGEGGHMARECQSRRNEAATAQQGGQAIRSRSGN